MSDDTGAARLSEKVKAEVITQIRSVAARATPEDKAAVARIIQTARKGNYAAEVVTITPPMAAIIFLEHNPHNRDWNADGTKSCREYSRRMEVRLWKQNNATIGFYDDGHLEDGQHRLSACAVAGFTWTVPVIYGIARDAIETVDDGLARHGADHAKLSGITDAKAKQTVVRLVSSYRVKMGDRSARLASEAEVHREIVRNDVTLTLALAVGNDSLENIIEPVMKPAPAQTLAYLMLMHGWSEQRIREKLALFQTGFSKEGEQTPYFVAGKMIKELRKKTESKERLSTVKELGVAIFAMVEAERGIRAITAGRLKAAVKQTLPNPAYPSDALDEAA